MYTQQRIVKTVGLLFLLQMTTAVISYSVILEPILNQEDYLLRLAEKANLVRLAMCLDLICGLSVFGIAVLLYPIFKTYNERIALWYAGLRLNELICFVISGMLLLTLLTMSLNLAGAGSSPSEAYSLLAQYLLHARGSTQNLSLFVYCFGTSMFYYLLFQTKLIPRFISIWGLLGVLLLFVEITANIFKTSVGGLLIMMPLGLNEVFLGIWLIVKGFDQNS